MFKSLDMGVDWDLLHRQKLILLEMRQDQPDDSPEADAITGIVHLLDSLQDDAVGLGLWEFPERSMLTMVGMSVMSVVGVDD